MVGCGNDARKWHWRYYNYKSTHGGAAKSRSTTSGCRYFLFCMATTIWQNTALCSDLLAPDFSLLLVLRRTHTGTLAYPCRLISPTTAPWHCCQHYIMQSQTL